MFKVDGLRVVLHERVVLAGADLHAADGALVALHGRNGSGRSTLLRALAGVVARSGRVVLDSVDIAAWPTWRIARVGLGFAPDTRDVFARLTVDEHFALIGQTRSWINADELLDVFAPLARRRRVLAGALSGGEQKLLAIARSALIARRVWLLDEPSEGLSAPMIAAVTALIGRARKAGVIVLVADGGERGVLGHPDVELELEAGLLKTIACR